MKTAKEHVRLLANQPFDKLNIYHYIVTLHQHEQIFQTQQTIVLL